MVLDWCSRCIGEIAILFLQSKSDRQLATLSNSSSVEPFEMLQEIVTKLGIIGEVIRVSQCSFNLVGKRYAGLGLT